MNFYSQVKYTNLPTVVLAGRPNVGKSTLFNRLSHKRRSITDPTPGVTRDPVAADVFLQDKPVRLIDSGGFKLDISNNKNSSGNVHSLAGSVSRQSIQTDIDRVVVQRTLQQIEQTDLIVLILAADDITAEDEEFIKLLRPLQDKVIVAVNKTEGGRLANEAWNLLSFGFETLYMISAEHGDNIQHLETAIISNLDFSKVKEWKGASTVEKPQIKITLVGKPNTGKSSLSNRLTASTASIVSEVPGTTRDIIEGAFVSKGRDFLILDTAGIRRKAKVNENIEYYSVNRAIKTFDDADVVILMIDAVEGLSDQDKKIASLACDKGRPVIFALNKWDLLPQIKNTYDAMCDSIRFFFGQMEYAPIIAVSAKDGTGINELLSTVVKMYGQTTTKTDTSDFNKALKRWQEESPPPSGRTTRFKIKYGLQTQTNPVKFKIFVSRPSAVTGSYTSYICNKIRKDLGYSLIPIMLEVLATRKERHS
ncbi:MAG: ribosome biogenesis GTPase Der [Termitinemataceae bacterium]|nr:MAG: ribosome biogenesis GTPase Der [Termitinemataceae bacterium]